MLIALVKPVAFITRLPMRYGCDDEPSPGQSFTAIRSAISVLLWATIGPWATIGVVEGSWAETWPAIPMMAIPARDIIITAMIRTGTILFDMPLFEPVRTFITATSIKGSEFFLSKYKPRDQLFSSDNHNRQLRAPT